MTVANNYAPVVTAANGSATVFSGSWNALSAANLVVQLLNTTTGIYTTVTQGVAANQYQVTTLTPTSFSITFNTAPASGNNVIMSRNTPQQQTIPYTTSRGFQGSVEEGSFDALTAMLQEISYTNTKAITAPVGDTVANLILPIVSLRAGLLLGFDASGNVIAIPGTPGPVGPAGTVVPWAIATGTGDAIIATFSPAISSLTDGLLVNVRVPGSNATTTPTLQANVITAHPITKKGGAAVAIGDIPGNLSECIFRYNLAHTRWELLNPVSLNFTVKQQIFLSSGTYTPSAGMIYCIAEGVDAGGGGGGVKIASSSNVAVATGGGGGAYFRSRFTAAQIGASQTVTIGAGGIAGTNTGGNGGNGGTTSLGSLMTGSIAPGGNGSTNATTSQATDGTSGGAGGIVADFSNAGGGSSGGFAIAGSTLAMGSMGGSPGNGGSGFSVAQVATGVSAGEQGAPYGCGGGGAIAVTNTTGALGGAGSNGYMIITEYCLQ